MAKEAALNKNLHLWIGFFSGGAKRPKRAIGAASGTLKLRDENFAHMPDIVAGENLQFMPNGSAVQAVQKRLDGGKPEVLTPYDQVVPLQARIVFGTFPASMT